MRQTGVELDVKSATLQHAGSQSFDFCISAAYEMIVSAHGMIAATQEIQKGSLMVHQDWRVDGRPRTGLPQVLRREQR
jgi:hypothetical protein